VVTLRVGRAHHPDRADEAEGLRYLLGWHQKLGKGDVITGTRRAARKR
jgi:hypothetical protein